MVGDGLVGSDFEVRKGGGNIDDSEADGAGGIGCVTVGVEYFAIDRDCEFWAGGGDGQLVFF